MMEELKKALKDLGYVSGTIKSQNIAPNRWKVWLDDEYVGIWDVVRKTFVD